MKAKFPSRSLTTFVLVLSLVAPKLLCAGLVALQNGVPFVNNNPPLYSPYISVPSGQAKLTITFTGVSDVVTPSETVDFMLNDVFGWANLGSEPGGCAGGAIGIPYPGWSSTILNPSSGNYYLGMTSYSSVANCQHPTIGDTIVAIPTGYTVTATYWPPAPQITAQPRSVTVIQGNSAIFGVTATGLGLSYQWQKNGNNIAGATSPTLTLNNVQPGDAGSYICVVVNIAGSVPSSAATLTVLIPASITAQPNSVAVMPGVSANFSVTATGTTPLSYQWKKNGVNLSGATASSLNIQTVSVANAGTYAVVVANSANSVTSGSATLSVGPAMTTQPANVTTTPGNTVNLVAAATGSPSPSYQWYFNNVAMQGQNSPTLAIGNVQVSNAGSYFVKVSNAVGAVNSQQAILTVLTFPRITAQPQPYASTVGETVSFAVGAIGAPPMSYQWYFQPSGGSNYSTIPGATVSTLTLTNVGLANAGDYMATISNSYGSISSSAAVLTVNPSPKITAEPLGQQIFAGQNATFSVSALGMQPLHFQWQLNGTNLPAGTNSTLIVTNAHLTDAGNYDVTVSNAYGSTNSSAASLVVYSPASLFNYFTTNTGGNGTITITAYIGPPGQVVVPNVINGTPVTALAQSISGSGFTNVTSMTLPNSITNIGSGAFFFCTNLTNINIPDSVIRIDVSAFILCRSLTDLTIGNGVASIGNYAFQGCTGLTNITIPDSVRIIGVSAFNDCTKLTSVTIGAGVTSFGNGVFENCSGLTSITVNPSNPSYTSTNGILLNKSRTTLVEYPGGLAGAYTISNDITKIGDYAFAGCFGLTSITIPSSVKAIGTNAFGNCTSLTNAIIGVGVTNIADDAFSSCGNLTYVTIGTNVANIGMSAFAGCNLSYVTIPSSVTNLGDEAFFYCTNLNYVYFEGNAPPLGFEVFDYDNATIYYEPGTTGWQSTFAGLSTSELSVTYAITNGAVTITGYDGPYGPLTIPEVIQGLPVVSIAPNACLGNGNLTGVTIPGSVTNIGSSAFLGCTALASVAVTNGLVTIGDGAFEGCRVLSSISIPDTVISVGDHAFANCNDLANAVIGAGVTNIGVGVFENSGFLTAISVDPYNLYYISLNGVLFNRDQTTLVEFPPASDGYTIPSSVTNIAEEAFAYSYVSTVVIPDSVLNIGNYAFYNGYYLSRASIGNGVTNIGTGAFECYYLQTVFVGSNVTSIGNNAFGATGGNFAEVCFEGNAPSGITNAFYDYFGNIYYLPGTSGWGSPIPDPERIPTNSPGIQPEIWIQFPHTTINGTVTITGYNAPGQSVTIPGMIDGMPVVNIASNAFAGANITSVIIPDSVTNIGYRAFANCLNLTNVNLGNGVTTIGAAAFMSCSFTTIAIPESMVDIEGAFYGCPLASLAIPAGVTNIDTIDRNGCPFTVDPNNRFYSSVNGILFNHDQTTVISFPIGTYGNYSIPNTVTTIGPGAFGGCDLSEITVPGSVTNIGDGAFGACRNLTNAIVENGTLAIGQEAFYDCPSLIDVTFYGNVTAIGDYAFAYCFSLQSVHFGGPAPAGGLGTVFWQDSVVLYYLEGSTGWENTGAVPWVMSLTPTNFGTRLQIVLSGYTGDETLTNFPVLVNLSTNLPGFSYRQFALPGGADLRFTDSSGSNLIPHEIDEWNTNGVSSVWVSMPALSSTNNSIWAYWGNPDSSVPDRQSNSVWLNAGYQIVYHMKESGFPYSDSAGQFSATTGIAPARTNGVIGHGQEFNGSNTYLTPGAVGLNSTFTTSAWVYLNGGATNIQTIWCNQLGGQGNNGFAEFVNAYQTADRGILIGTGDGSAAGQQSEFGHFSVNQWHLFTAVFDQPNSNFVAYLDGSVIATGPVTGDFGLTNDLYLGAVLNPSFWWTGAMDEARIRNGISSSNWVSASWQTVASNASFESYSSVVQQSSALQAGAVQGGLQMSWPAGRVDMRLYSTTNLASAESWTMVTNVAPQLVNDQWLIAVPANDGHGTFYQLRSN